uniref:Mediator of RNA polymerase II transcription subunit 21 n=1 Tax=Heterorhabditis bacteriophora TaxID=37862 RepID=A0A1I7WDC3_HETBA
MLLTRPEEKHQLVLLLTTKLSEIEACPISERLVLIIYPMKVQTRLQHDLATEAALKRFAEIEHEIAPFVKPEKKTKKGKEKHDGVVMENVESLREKLIRLKDNIMPKVCDLLRETALPDESRRKALDAQAALNDIINSTETQMLKMIAEEEEKNRANVALDQLSAIYHSSCSFSLSRYSEQEHSSSQ